MACFCNCLEHFGTQAVLSRFKQLAFFEADVFLQQFTKASQVVRRALTSRSQELTESLVLLIELFRKARFALGFQRRRDEGLFDLKVRFEFRPESRLYLRPHVGRR